MTFSFLISAQSINPETKSKLKQVYSKIVNRSWDEADSLLIQLWKLPDVKSNKRTEAKLCEIQGIYHELLGTLDSAEFLYLKSKKLYEFLSDKKGLFSAMNNLALLNKKKGDFTKSINISINSLEIAKKLEDKTFLAKAHHNLSITLRKDEDYKGAVNHAFKALKIFEESGDSTMIIAAKNGIGILYQQLSNYRKAVKYYNEVYAYSKRQSDTNTIAVVLGNLGSVNHKLGKDRESIRYNFKSLELEVKRKNPEGICISYLLLGHNYSAIEQLDSAVYFYKKLQEISSKHAYFDLEAKSLIDLAKINIRLGKLSNAEKSLKEVHKIILSKSFNKLFLPYYEEKKNLFLANGEIHKAVLYYDSLILFQETTLITNLNEKLDRNEINSNILSLRREKESLKEDSKNKGELLLYFGVGFILILFFIAIIVRAIKKRKEETGKELEQLKLEVSDVRLELKKRIDEIHTYKDAIDSKVELFNDFTKSFPNLPRKLTNQFSEKRFTTQDLQICTLLLINCPNHKGAWILGLTDAAFGMARLRLRKKLNEPNDQKLKLKLESIIPY